MRDYHIASSKLTVSAGKHANLSAGDDGEKMRCAKSGVEKGELERTTVCGTI